MKTGTFLSVAASALLLAACIPGKGEPRPPEPGKPDPAARAECEARGGEYARGGLLGSFLCFRPTEDAGKSCARASDCEGICYADSRQCSQVVPEFGCIPMLDEDGRRVEICID